MHKDPFLNKCMHGLEGIIWRNGERVNPMCPECVPPIGDKLRELQIKAASLIKRVREAQA
jgi:hypothetical protein